MKPGIKPIHLWGWTPRKWFDAVQKDYFSIKNIGQRSKMELLKTNVIVMSIFASLMYSYGMFNPKEMITRMIKERSCETAEQSIESESEPSVSRPPAPEVICPPKKKKHFPDCP